MLSQIRSWLSLSMYENDEDLRVARVMRGLASLFLLVAGSLLIVGWLWGSHIYTLPLALFCLFQVLILALLFQGNLSAASYAAILIYIFFITVFATVGKGMRDYSIMAYPVVIVFAGLAEKQRGLIVATLLSFASLAWLIFGEVSGWFISHPFTPIGWFDLIVTASIVASVAFEINMLVGNLKDRLTQLRRELFERKHIEAALRESEEKLKEIFDNSPDNIFVADVCPDGKFRINTVNAALEKIFNAERSVIEGKYLDDLLDAGSAAVIAENFRRCVKTKTQLRYEEFASLPGRSYSTSLTPIFDDAGDVVRLIGVSRDITERIAAENALRKSEARYRSLFNDAPVMIWEEDFSATRAYLEGLGEEANADIFAYLSRHPEVIHECLARLEIINVNDAVLKFFGARDLTHLLENLPLTFTNDAFLSFSEALAYLVQGRRFFERETTQRAFNGEIRHVFVRNFLQADENHAFLRVIITMLDITERKRAEAALIKSEELIRNINDNLVLGMVYQLLRLPDGTRKFTYLSDAVQNLYGVLPEQGMADASLIYNRVHEEDRARVSKEEDEAYRALSVFKSEIRMLNPDGSIRWSSFTSNPKDLGDGVTCWDGIEFDITERKRIEFELRESREMYRLLAENISDVIWIFDVNEMRTRYISPSVERLRGYTVGEAISGNLSVAVTPDMLPEVLEKIRLRIKAFHEGYRGSYVDELRQTHRDGYVVWTEVHTNFHLNEDNGHLEMYGVSRDISERKRNERMLETVNEQLNARMKEIEALHAELREQAVRDPMTGLYNRRYMEDVFSREFSRAGREEYEISVIMLDLDDLKKINDAYGHQIGDLAIQTLADCLKNMTRVEDVVCRYGGDEFIIAMSKTSAGDAFKRVEEWRAFLSATPMHLDAREVPVNFTAGIACYPIHGATMGESVHYADVALYRAKARGRGRALIFE